MHGIIESVNLKDQIYEIIRDMILRRDINPGEKIVEDDLSKQIGVSRTPLREALSRLENEGIVKIIPRRGAFVSELSKTTIIEVLQIREVLEGLVTRLAAENMTKKILGQLKASLDYIKDTPDEPEHLIKFTHADEKFHSILLTASKNQMLQNFMSNINMHLQFIRIRTVVIPNRAKKTVNEHYMILDAIEQKNIEKAEELMRQHITSVRDYAIQHIDSMK
ncbi:MAG: GntR family transcriptional regulator [Deltaproteobacteria bacterium]|nr:GntR family transcriptional regulator [Deltaproteobacteria bacterium]MBT4640355.1 GntR family transcriptional regulator [Deltaproteobacteria bacterium]MBT7154338.1 GntR family transcriptional regulator [Deltaproteobacteria bacterium]